MQELIQRVTGMFNPQNPNEPPNPSANPNSAPNPQRRPLPSPKDALKRATERVDAADNSASDRQDTINLAYYKGKQWISWDSGNRRVFEPPPVQNKTRYVANRIMKMVRTEYSKILKNRAIMNVIPASSQEEDIEAARIGDKVAEWIEYDKNCQDIDEQVVLWGLTTRIAWVQPYWNPSLGELADANDGTKTGDVDFDILSPFEMVFDPAATNWRDVAWACKIKTRTVEYIKAVYGVDVKPEDGITTSNLYESRMNFATLHDNISYTPVENAARVYEYWERPCADYPNGYRVTYVKNREEPLQYLTDIGFGEQDNTERILPFFPFVHIRIPGSVSGTNIVEQLIPLQREYNRCRSQVIDNKDAFAYAKLTYVTGSVDERDLNDDTQGLIEVKPGAEKPSFLQPKPVAMDAYRNMEQIVDEMYFVSGQQDVTHGNAPSDASGFAISLLQEADDTVIAPSVENFLRCKQGYMSYALKIMRFRCIAPRLLRIVNKDLPEMVEFAGTMLTSTDIRMQRGSIMQNSKPARQAQLINLVTLGVLDPAKDRDRILQDLEFGTLDTIYSDAALDTRQAKEEQAGWERGEVLPVEAGGVRDFFNHDVHLQEHNKFRKSKKYTTLPPDLQAAIDEHCEAHNLFIMNAAMAMAGMPQAAPPQSAGTPHSPQNLTKRVANGEPVGNPLQGQQPNRS